MPERPPLPDFPEPPKRKGGRPKGVPNKPITEENYNKPKIQRKPRDPVPGRPEYGTPEWEEYRREYSSRGGKKRTGRRPHVGNHIGSLRAVKWIIDGAVLDGREAKFAQAYVELLNGKAAATVAGYKETAADEMSRVLLLRPHVAKAIQTLFDERAKRLEISQDQVVRYWWNLAHADAREFAVRTNCRYCWGEDFQYQFTLNELRQAKQEHYEKQLKRPESSRVPFDDLGGDGYDLTRDPNPECPECRGLGAYNPQALDLGAVSPTAAMLYNGMKPIHGGYDIGLRDRSYAMLQVQKLLGFEVDRRLVLVKAPDLEKLSDGEIVAAIKQLEKKVDLDENEFSEVGDDGNVIDAEGGKDK
jgi:phage terminase small subunit